MDKVHDYTRNPDLISLYQQKVNNQFLGYTHLPTCPEISSQKRARRG